MYQKITIIGNLGNDPEVRFMPDGTPVTGFSVATNRKWKNADGSAGEETVWFQVSAWGRLAETTNRHLSKGRQVYVEGRLTPDRATGGPRIWTAQRHAPCRLRNHRAGTDIPRRGWRACAPACLPRAVCGG